MRTTGRAAERLGVFGGTFNPVHLGHLILAQDAIEELGLDRLLLIPCAVPPHKSCPDLPEGRHRMAMLRSAIRGDPRLAVSDIELRRGGRSFAVETVRTLRQRFPRGELLFIIGSDSLPELHLWKDIGELLRLCEFRVFERPGHSLGTMRPEALGLPPPTARGILRHAIRGHRVDVSSSDIRARRAAGRGIRYLVPRTVEAYIVRHGLYVRGSAD